MRDNPGHILLSLALVLCLGFSAAASPQGDGHDRALDKYAAICDRCLRLRADVESGQGVRKEELKALLTELSSLRKTLSNASGEMTAAQRERFEAIKAKYQRGMQPAGQAAESKSGNIPGERTARRRFAPLPAVASLPVAPATAPVTVPVTVPATSPVTEPVEVTSHTLPPRRVGEFGSSSAGRPEAKPRRQSARRSFSGGMRSRPFGVAVLADAGIFPAPSYGAMTVATWRGVGAYATWRSNFRKNEYSYSCTSDGDTEYGRIWATGNSRVSRSVAIAGLAMFPSGRFGFYAGGGLTSYTRCLEDVSGQWARVKDESFRTLAVDAGMLLTFNPLVFSVGVTSDFAGHADVRIGVGVRFR